MPNFWRRYLTFSWDIGRFAGYIPDGLPEVPPKPGVDFLHVTVREGGRGGDYENYPITLPVRPGLYRASVETWGFNLWVSDDLQYIAGDRDLQYLLEVLIPDPENWDEIEGLHAQVRA